ncbi:TetR/AcrR family transcriptional regulator [Mycobacteroides abscessus subsp. abscessus]|uniref:TetR/AcrR family transcriptional regulator n=1 Tax=Mycobacteroides abscessus TaxID=36809 RepID=UPI00092AF729|nr:TetR/AcrR family transcriptional regulator [Mycobacteroides abscessus]AWG51796.1 TetR/AcrR family transcriptional regulator [Mycobacteroides abscessus]MDO3099908.1 TetR/AcrR family transcriptional regulator [Mycobacteroides abscessus subsp. abscessus]MDO3187000.1 TetR/AcrR family transcriptional regulator [Mycobacteroides abscessus subsp. abscessus]MDO3192956.1 TetR/AcrR family transcriptional regulator [Mycobacteroides abscessus subsp. abscessus]MDO3287010.1 TetR/AcrR family transcriptiona
MIQYSSGVPPASNAGVARRRAILDAALTSFLKSGVAGATVEALHRESGASVGSIYHFFRSKEGVAAELYLETLRDYYNAYLAVLQSSSGPHDGVVGAVSFHLQWVAANEMRARFLFHCREFEVIEESRSTITALHEDFYSQASAWLQPHVEKRRIKPLPPRLCQALWMGPCVEYARLWLARSADFDMLAAAPVLGQAAWDAVKV